MEDQFEMVNLKLDNMIKILKDVNFFLFEAEQMKREVTLIIATDNIKENSIDNKNKQIVKCLNNTFDTEGTNATQNLSHKWIHTSSNSPQQELENKQEDISWMTDDNDIDIESTYTSSTFINKWQDEERDAIIDLVD